MGILLERAGWIVAGFVLLATLTARSAVGQNEPTSATISDSYQAAVPCPKPPCRETGNSTRPNLALPLEAWPPTSHGAADDQFDSLQTQCPNKDDYYINPPRMDWYARVDGAGICRAHTHTIEFQSVALLPQTVGAAAPNTYSALSTADFTTDLAASGRLLVGHTLNEDFQIEASYLGVCSNSYTEAVRDPNSLLYSPFSDFGYYTPIAGLDNNRFAQITYETSLQSVELNIRRQIPMPPEQLTVSFFFGVRYLALPEQFHYRTTCASGSAAIDVNTDNQMIGPQIGALCEFYAENRWWINFEAKAALLNNRGSQTTAYDIDSGSYAGAGTHSVKEDHTTFAGELNLYCVYRWSPHFNTRIGYQAMLLTDTVYAPANFNTNIDMLTQGPAQLHNRTNAVYHGPFAGVEFAW